MNPMRGSIQKKGAMADEDDYPNFGLLYDVSRRNTK